MTTEDPAGKAADKPLDKRREAHDLLIKAKTYRLLATIFAIVGLLLFLVLYFRHVDGNVVSALKRPLLLLLMFVPFLPAIVLTRKAEKASRQYSKLVEKPASPAAPAEPPKA